MLSHLLPLTLLLGMTAAAADEPTPAALERAHSLLAGTWTVAEITDDGEPMGSSLIRAKLAEGGRIRIANRLIQITSPETGETRSLAFRINPARSPREIDVISPDDRIVQGIYRIEDDSVFLNLQLNTESTRPTAFEAPTGSGRMLIKLTLAKDEKPAPVEATTPTVVIEVQKVETPAPVATPTPAPVATPAPAPAPAPAPTTTTTASLTTQRRPTESEIERFRELFKGEWDILSILDDGEDLGPTLIRERFAENGRIEFGTRAFAIVNPRTEARRVKAYRIDPSRTPSEIDVSTQFDDLLKGIFRFEGERLTICLSKHEETARPTRFEAPAGSDHMLIELRLATLAEPSRSAASAPKVVTASETRPFAAPAPAPAAALTPAPAASVTDREATIRRMLKGSWASTDPKGDLTVVFQDNSTFVATRVWSKSSRRLFGPASDSSNGTWNFAGNMLTASVRSTTDRKMAGHTVYGRVNSIGEDTMVVTDAFGSVRTFRRLR
jgi:uncharacterized protein (TIGR03067 family)